MSNQWDLSVYDRNGQLALVVEVKSILGKTPAWAAQFRRNILAHGILPNPPYLLMAFPDRFYLWRHGNGELIEPDYVIDARPILQPYLDQAGISADQISGSSFELIVASWLNDLLYRPSNELEPDLEWLVNSGLYKAVAGGRLEYRVPA
jgi:hypothetical protein